MTKKRNLLSIVLFCLIAAGIGYALIPNRHFVRAEIVEMVDENGNALHPERKIVVTDQQAEEISALFPGAGNWRLFAMFSASGSRYHVELFDKDGHSVLIAVDRRLEHWSDKDGGLRDLDPSARKVLADAMRQE